MLHQQFRNRAAMQTHPLNPERACVIHRSLKVPSDGKTSLKLGVSHHPHGDWQLRVLADKQLLVDRIVGAKTIRGKEWLDVEVDLSQLSGKTIQLSIQNKANNWHNEWAYWSHIEIVHEH